MNKASLTVLVSLSMLASAAYAQEGGVATSTDPAKAADVEQRAQALRAQQQMQPESAAPSTPHEQMHHKQMHHRKNAMKHEEGASARPANE